MSGAVRTGESLTLSPSGGRWRGLVRRTIGEDARRDRAAVGLAVDRPVVMTGHQAAFWHPGILAKYLAADAVDHGAAVAWLVVDQDRAATVSVAYPGVDEGGRLRRREMVLPRTGAGAVPGDAHASVRAGLARVVSALGARAVEETLARRVAMATRDLLAPLRGGAPEPTVLMATGLGRAPGFAELVERMSADPERCVLAYNAAAAAHPGAGVRALSASDVQDRWELPLWWLPPGKPRRHVFAEDLASIPRGELAPKALVMTLLVRARLCDLFIHGTGGGTGGGAEEDGGHEGYDRVMEEWLERWLGAEAARWRLAPAVVATATRWLPLGGGEVPTAAEVARARWRAHHARHHPAEVGDAAGEARRAALVERVRTARGAERARAFAALQAELEAYRRARAAELAGLERAAGDAAARAAEVAIRRDRTWPWPLYPEGVLHELREAIFAEIGRG